MKSLTINIRILGGGKEVGRAAVLVERDDKGVLLDYGVLFDENDIPQLPLHINPQKIQAIALTHVHLDHLGAIPYIYISKSPPIYTTRITIKLSRYMLEDFIKLSGYYLPFEYNEVLSMIDNSKPVSYGEILELGGISMELRDAGHIPGSSMVKVYVKDKVVLYTGDINVVETRLTKPLDFTSLNDVQVLIMEATYGAVTHPPRKLIEELFIESVREVIENGGTVLVPAFSVGRSQEILSLLAERAPYLDVYYDGMVRTISDIMLEEKTYLNKPNLLEKALKEFNRIRGWSDRRKAWKTPSVIIASAGMLKGGPALYYAKKLSDSPKNAIFLVSFQAEGTPGRNILKLGRIFENQELVKARIEWFDFSSHAGKDGLIKLIKQCKNLEKIIIIHSDEETAYTFAKHVEENIGVETHVAENADIIKLE